MSLVGRGRRDFELPVEGHKKKIVADNRLVGMLRMGLGLGLGLSCELQHQQSNMMAILTWGLYHSHLLKLSAVCAVVPDHRPTPTPKPY